MSEENPSVKVSFYDGEAMLEFMRSVWSVAEGLNDGSILAGQGANKLFEAYTIYESVGIGGPDKDA